MKTNIISILALGAALLGAVSCSEDWNPTTADEGSVALASLSLDTSDAEKLVTGTGSRAGVDTKDFIVSVTNKTGEPQVRTWTYSQMPEILVLPVGEYTVEAKSHQVQKAEWDRPYYLGSKDFKIENGKITNVGEVVCSFASRKVSVIFAEDLRKVMGDDVVVTVTANNGGVLEFTPDKEGKNFGFFEVVKGSTTMVAHFEGSINGVKTSYDTPFADVEAGQHRQITYKTKNNPDIPEQSGTIDPSTGIQLDTEVIKVDVNGNVTVEEDILDPSDRPGKEDPKEPEGPDDPQPPVTEDPVTFDFPAESQINFEGTFTPSQISNASVNIACPKGIKNLVVTIDTSSDEFKDVLAGVGLPLSFDLANPGSDELEEAIAGLGLPCANGGVNVNGDEYAPVLNQTSVPFDISGFMTLLFFEGNHNFVLTVTDNDGKSVERTLKFKV